VSVVDELKDSGRGRGKSSVKRFLFAKMFNSVLPKYCWGASIFEAKGTDTTRKRYVFSRVQFSDA